MLCRRFPVHDNYPNLMMVPGAAESRCEMLLITASSWTVVFFDYDAALRLGHEGLQLYLVYTGTWLLNLPFTVTAHLHLAPQIRH